MIAEIEVDIRTGRIWARRVTVAHDCGLSINPQGLQQTIEGNMVHGLSRVLFEEVRFGADTGAERRLGELSDPRDAPMRRKRSTS